MRGPGRGVYSQNADPEDSGDTNAKRDCVEKREISCLNSNFKKQYIYIQGETDTVSFYLTSN